MRAACNHSILSSDNEQLDTSPLDMRASSHVRTRHAQLDTQVDDTVYGIHPHASLAEFGKGEARRSTGTVAVHGAQLQLSWR